MRSVILLIVGLFIATLGFTIYWMVSGAEVGGTHSTAPHKPTADKTPLPDDPKSMPGKNVWVNNLDQKTGRLTSRFKAATYERLPDGRWGVTQPEAQFLVAQGRVLHIEGQTGTILTEQGLGRSRSSLGGETMSQAPRSGELHVVTVRRYSSIQMANELADKSPQEKDAAADLTLVTPCASFDNETFLIQTEPYTDADGKLVRADDVPLTLRGTQYQFDGFGLKLQYDQLEQRLAYLRIARGKRLEIKDAKFMKVQAMPQSSALAWFDPESMLAAADDATVAQAKPVRKPAAPRAARPGAKAPAKAPPVKAPPATRPAVQPVYRAVFQKNVDIFQGDEKVASAAQMDVEFISENDDLNPVAASGTQPATHPAAEAPAPVAAPPPAAPATHPARPHNAEHAASDRPAPERPVSPKASRKAASTQPSQPVVILWTGPLEIRPLADRPARIAPGESIVKLTGNAERPVDVYRTSMRGSERIVNHLRCAALTHWTIDQGALLEEGKDLPVEMSDSRGPRGAHVVTHRMVFSQAEKTAVLTGKSTATLPVDQSDSDPAKPPRTELMNVAWSDRCTLEFEGNTDDMVVKQSRLEGDVSVDHPQLKMKSRYLDLFFNNDAPATAARGAATQPSRSSPQLEQLRANGAVHCEVNGPAGPQDVRKLDCDDLRLSTAQGADGRLFARNILATGSVNAVDPQRSLKAGYLNVVLAEPAPHAATQPAGARSKEPEIAPGELRSLLAHDAVHVTTADGKTADADELRINVANGETLVTLTGAPAKVQREKDTLTGPFITMVPETQRLTVTGKGEMHGTQRAANGQQPRPFDVTWNRTLEGLGNTIEATGEVVAKSVDADGALNTARGDRVIITTAPRPTTQPAVATGGPATQPAVAAARKKSTTQPAGELDAMADREIQSIILRGNALSDSILNDPQGNLLRMMQVKSDEIQFYQPDPKHKRLVIPGAGTMLFVDNRPPGKDAAAQEAAKDPMGMRGQTAFGWQRSLVYDETASQLTMLGSVVIGRKEANAAPNAVPMQIFADKVVADIEPAPEGATTQPAGLGPDFSSKLQFKNVHLVGDPLRVQNDQLNIEAQSMDYDPARHLLTARGEGRKRVKQIGTDGLVDASFDEFVWDTQKSLVVRSTNPIFERRK